MKIYVNYLIRADIVIKTLFIIENSVQFEMLVPLQKIYICNFDSHIDSLKSALKETLQTFFGNSFTLNISSRIHKNPLPNLKF